MKPLATLPDVERLVVDYLTTALASRASSATVGVVVPPNFKPKSSPAHVQVALDGTTEVNYPISAVPTVRITAWAGTTTAAKALASLCEGLLLSYGGSHKMPRIHAGTGLLPAHDNETGAELASITVEVTVRYQVLS